MTVQTLALIALTSTSAIPAGGSALPPEAEAVRQYILQKEYPEVFGGVQYRVQIQNLIIADVDNDGQNEVIVEMEPHFRQSATIVIFKVSKDLLVTRVKEELAPGPLRPLSGSLLDSHESGYAADLSVDKSQGDQKTKDSVVEAILEQFTNVVAYATFFHVDSRAGAGSYIDMTQVDAISKDKTCESFEFSKVRAIAVGHLAGQEGNSLAAWVGDEIWLYRIYRVKEDGLLEKAHWVVKAPVGFSGFLPADGLAYKNDAGLREVLSIDTARQ